MDVWAKLFDILLLLIVAMFLGGICTRLRQSAIVGYLLAGVLLGPGALNVFQTEAEVEVLAELGVALLLFTIGLEFSWKRLKSLGAVAIWGGHPADFTDDGDRVDSLQVMRSDLQILDCHRRHGLPQQHSLRVSPAD